MIDFEKINCLTCEEVIFVGELKEVANAAKVAAEVIRRTYFPCGHEATENIEVFQYAGNMQYLTGEGMWQARYKDWNYDVKCTEEGIFEFYKKEFLIRTEVDKNASASEKKNIISAREAFRYFVVRTDRKMRVK